MTNGQIYRRFTVVTVIMMVAVIVISLVVDQVLGIDVGSGAGIVSLFVPAMDAGGTYVRATRTLLEKGRMWRMSCAFFGINLAVGLLIFIALFVVSGASFLAAFAQIGLFTFLIILLVMAAILIPITRFSLGFGARLAFKQLEK
ncbi:MAG: ABZJ_00895 family protein [Tateyamaria sp.]|uniref:ABZJ_00895 family protein n=1 Tax=Tateyamaria sp. TaxID=1929288 RepID=UPI00329FB750